MNQKIKYAEFPDGEQPVITQVQITYTQQADNLSPQPNDDNTITLTYDGDYCTISTTRWSIDTPEELTQIINDFYSRIK